MGYDSEHPSSDSSQAATLWVARRDSGLNAAESRELCAWLAASPEHAAAFSKADTRQTELDWPLHSGTIGQILAGVETRARQRRRRRRSIVKVGAGVGALGVLMAVALGFWWHPDGRSGPAPSMAAVPPAVTVLEPERLILPDGSVVELKDGARITTDFSGEMRRVNLSHGTAHFKVTPNERPFIVRSAGVVARALGTAFVVERDGHSVSVIVTEGTVAVNKRLEVTPSSLPSRVESVEPPVILNAGAAVSIPISNDTAPFAPSVVAMPATEVEDRLAWRIPRLKFNDTPLAEVVVAINRHNRRQLVITDSALGTLALSGVLRADKVDALVSMLESDLPIVAERQNERIFLRTKR